MAYRNCDCRATTIVGDKIPNPTPIPIPIPEPERNNPYRHIGVDMTVYACKGRNSYLRQLPLLNEISLLRRNLTNTRPSSLSRPK